MNLWHGLRSLLEYLGQKGVKNLLLFTQTAAPTPKKCLKVKESRSSSPPEIPSKNIGAPHLAAASASAARLASLGSAPRDSPGPGLFSIPADTAGRGFCASEALDLDLDLERGGNEFCRAGVHIHLYIYIYYSNNNSSVNY